MTAPWLRRQADRRRRGQVADRWGDDDLEQVVYLDAGQGITSLGGGQYPALDTC